MHIDERFARLTPDQRRAFAARLKQRGLPAEALPIVASGLEQRPLSLAQTRLWFLEQLEAGTGALSPTAMRVPLLPIAWQPTHIVPPPACCGV